MQPQAEKKSGLKKKVKNKNWGYVDSNQQKPEQKLLMTQNHVTIQQWRKAKRYKNVTQMASKYTFSTQSVLGCGFASTVYLGNRCDNNQMVCIKVIDMLKLGHSQNQIELVHKQIQFLHKFQSDYIIRLYDVYQSNTFFYLVMQLCPGGDLYKMLKLSPSNLPSQFISIVIKQVVRGLKQIHQQNLVHRDLKTQNIFILRFPQTQKDQIKVKIGDLGFCISLQQLQRLKGLGSTIQNVGSPIYMSVEVSKNQNYSFSSDIYSLGILWYELYHKKAPWQAKSQQQLLLKKISEPASSCKWRQDIQEKIKQIILLCISNDPQKRPSCQQILKILQNEQKCTIQQKE